MKKLFVKTLLLFLIFHFSSLISAAPAAAHVLKSDGSVGAVLHVSPDDDPIVGVSTDFFFEMKDTSGEFTPENCNCVASVSQNGKEMYSQPLFQHTAKPSLDDASFSYVLPEKGIYQITISGTPINSGSFEPFVLTWDIRAEKDSPVTESTTNWFVDALPYLLGFLLFLGILMFLNKKGGVKKK